MIPTLHHSSAYRAKEITRGSPVSEAHSMNNEVYADRAAGMSHPEHTSSAARLVYISWLMVTCRRLRGPWRLIGEDDTLQERKLGKLVYDRGVEHPK